SKHNPMPHFMVTQNAASCATNDVSFDAQGSMPGFAADLAAGTVFNYNFIAPNLCNDGHDSCGGVAKVTEQDNFLAANLPALLASSAYQDNGLIIVTWDEGSGSTANSPSQIATIYLSPML